MDNNLTESQQEALNQFKKNVSDILTPHDTDPILIKWLRVKNYNPRKAAILFREMHDFKEVYELETSHDEYVKPEVVQKYEYTAFLGFAKDGSIVRYNPIGKGDHLGFIMSMDAFAIGAYATNIMMEDFILQRKEKERTGREINEITYIFDMEDFSINDILHKCVLEMALDLGVMVQEYYPEVWGNIFFINVPPYFDTTYNIFKPILRNTVIQKLQVVSRESVPKVLLKYIDADVLPAFLGGNRVDSKGDPRCSEFLEFGGKVPTELYLCNRHELLMPTDPGTSAIWLSPRAAYNYSVIVTKPDSTIRIEFRTENGSIHLRILFRNLGPDPDKQDIPTTDEHLDERDEKTNVQLISPGMWIQSHLTQVNASCRAPWPGIYIFRFNNARSIFGSRRILYRFEVIEPDYCLL